MSSHTDDAPTIETPDDSLPTISGATRAPSSRPTPSTPSSSRGADSARFTPGVIVAGRYRLIALLGKGGMGEVYRAEDLTLEQPVALKFLPQGVAEDGPALAQFHNELRTARQVSHKNVCRLYDLGEANGRRFLTMEYIDGEDLASLLRRIGRVPHDKAVEISRQLCAGLSAAHDRGVVHRDLKPANVMLDGDGNVRITDFGLAVAETHAGSASFAGTPQYMAPEQLKGTPASVKTDIYALGLILFEIFTGKRVHNAKSVDELLAHHESGAISTPSSVVRDLDPLVERVILRCLDKNPEARPTSALAVAAALPGGDPLAAALAAGETPSPEVVAAAGQISALKPLVGLSIVAAILVGLVAAAAIADRTYATRYVWLTKPRAVFADRAAAFIEKFGYTDVPADTADGIITTNDGLNYIAAHDKALERWRKLSTGAYPVISYWYRSSPRPFVPWSNEMAPTPTDPPATLPRMLSMELDIKGRLTRFSAVPPQNLSPVATGSFDWTAAFEAAGLNMSRFSVVAPQWTPPTFAHERFAWEGPLFDEPVQAHVEAAAFNGAPVYFAVLGPWSRPIAPQAAPTSTRQFVLNTIEFAVLVTVIVASLAMARRHVKTGRGDVQGALSVAAIYVGLSIVIWAFHARHQSDLARELDTFQGQAGRALWRAGLVGFMYFALEPYVRKFSPELLFSWTRVIRGHFRDPLVGRDLLCGLGIGIATGLVVDSFFLYYRQYVALRLPSSGFLNGPAEVVSQLTRILLNGPQNAMFMTFVYVGARALTKRRDVSAAIALAVYGALFMREFGEAPLLVSILLPAAFAGLMVFALLRFGVLAAAVASTTTLFLNQGLLTLDASNPYFATSAWTMASVLAAIVFGYYSSRGDEALFGKAFE